MKAILLSFLAFAISCDKDKEHCEDDDCFQVLKRF
jgi:hypothetical protein